MPTIVGYGSPMAVIRGSVSAALRPASSASSACTSACRFASADTPSRPAARVGRAPGHGQPERDRAGVGDDDVEARGLGDDREVARRPGPDRRQGALPAVLLRRHERHHELAGERVERARVAQGADRAQDRGHAALHVAGAAPEQAAVADLGRPRVDRPRRGIAGRHDVHVARQHQPAPARRPDAAEHDRERSSAAPPRPASPGRRGSPPGRGGTPPPSRPSDLEPVGQLRRRWRPRHR